VMQVVLLRGSPSCVTSTVETLYSQGCFIMPCFPCTAIAGRLKGRAVGLCAAATGNLKQMLKPVEEVVSKERGAALGS